MISEAQRTAILKSIDFGDIDGYGDPNLDHYFLDNDYWNKITNEDTFFVAGRKGTGKSAIYRMIEEQSIEKGAIVHNTDFGDYPFNRLLSLSDDGFSRPNQYQSIWRYMIFSDFARLISLYPVEDDFNNRHYQELDQFVRLCLGNSIADLYKELLSRTTKTEIGLSALQISPTSAELFHCKSRKPHSVIHERHIQVHESELHDAKRRTVLLEVLAESSHLCGVPRQW